MKAFLSLRLKSALVSVPVRTAVVGGITSLLIACSSERSVVMQTTSHAPAAQATLRYKVEDNNTKLKLKVDHLAPPEKVAPGASSYVVWVLPTNGNPPQNVGSLDVSKELEAELETSTPYRNLSVFVTPEKAATATAPSGERVLTSTTLQ